MVDGRWRISVTAPDWGQDHLSSDAIVAFVDGELAPGPHRRATQHLRQCPECAAQVGAQGQARSALRTAAGPSLPSSLLTSLRSIPQDTDLPAPPAGLAMTADGQLVAVVRPEPDAPRPTGNRTEPDDPAAASEPGRRTSAQRRMRLGTGVAVSGLALGALALGVPAASTGPLVPGPAASDRGALGGSVLGGPGLSDTSAVVDAGLRIAPTAAPTTTGRPDPTVADRITRFDQVSGPGPVRGLR